MKPLVLIPLFLFAALAPLGAQAPAPQPAWLNCSLVPGWQAVGSPRNFTADTLFEYRDGGAEGYLQYGFSRMQGLDCKQGAVVLSIDVSEMGSPDLAWGMLMANRDPAQPETAIGMGAQLEPESLLFAKGNFYVEIVETDGATTNNLTEPLKAFAAKIEPLLEGRSTPPAALNWFPAEHRTELRLIPESVLGIRLLKQGFVAKYEQGQAFVVEEDSAASAAEVMKKLAARFSSAAPVQLADQALAGKVQYLDGICIFQKGKRIAGYTNQPDGEAALALARKLAEKLPAD